eukprot:m.146420 g.146420  ORF g.146420 m.146420 type:complete len:612 (+) comp14970_c0_seq4:217-2052(+)
MEDDQKKQAAKALQNTDQLEYALADDQINVVTHGAGVAPKKERETWGNKTQFMLSCIGYAVGLGNVWRFPYLCYRNGGGAFLIPYTLMLFLVGMPVFFLELSLGQKFQAGAWGTFEKISPALRGIGGASLVVSFLVGMYYNTIVAYSLLYLFFSFTSHLPWDGFGCPESNKFWNCTQLVNSSQTELYWYLGAMDASDAIGDTGDINWKIFGVLLLAWVIVMFCEIKGIESSGYVVYFTATFPYLVLIILFFRAVTLPGAGNGIEYYLKPDFAMLQYATVWRDACTQILYSLSPGFGTLIAFASYNPPNNDALKDTFVICLINCGTSVFAGFVVFAFIGFMAHEKNAEIEDVVSSGPGLAFEVYPEAVLQLPLSVFWAILFFLMLLTLGLDSMFGTVEGILTIILDMNKNLNKTAVVIGICALSFLCGLIFTCQAGVYFFELWDTYSAGLPLITIVLCECLTISYVYGADKYLGEVETMINRKVNNFWWYAWKFVTPVILFVILIWNVIFQFLFPGEYATLDGFTTYPSWALLLGWLLILSSVLFIPGVALYHYDISGPAIKRSFRNLTWRRFKSELRPAVRATFYQDQVLPTFHGIVIVTMLSDATGDGCQ